MQNNFESTFDYKLIYIFRINDEIHKGCLKIGDATIHTKKRYNELAINCHDLNYAARQRIDQYTSTAGIKYELLYTEIALYKVNDKKNKHYGKIRAFRDYDVHNVLKRSNVKKKFFDTNANEWYICDLQTAINAIQAVKKEKSSLNNNEISENFDPIILRPEQEKAVNDTITRYKNKSDMLWNAKMRFGKTITALEVVKRMKFKKTIICTHRPVVLEGWYEDFKKIFYERDNKYKFGSKTKGENLNSLLKNNNPYIYFASIQDLRGSDVVGGNFDKNNEIFKNEWDFIILDEAHEGTQTTLGIEVKNLLKKDSKNHITYTLELSGTPFNLMNDRDMDSIYTWDYIMEQEAKNNWTINHFGDHNPYDELPKMNIFTYHLEKSLPQYIDTEDKAFNFREFFRVWTGDIQKDFKRVPKESSIGDFVHKEDIISFLNLLCKKDDNNNYPFATEEYRDYFRHSLWILPGVKEAKALSRLLKNHIVFGNNEFEIVNVAGDGDEEQKSDDALKLLRDNITDHPENTRTITLSCGRLTTGVTVPEWTAVLMLAGTYSTAASQYLQTIFRVQSPANINGRIKQNCYVFDFAPDRTLKMVAESINLSAKAGKSNTSESIALGKLLNYCPVIAIEGSNMKEFTVNQLLRELKKAYSERVLRNGFDDPKIYNDKLLKLTDIELKEFEKLKAIVGTSKQSKPVNEIDINKEGYSDEELDELKKLKNKKNKSLTPEELAIKKELKEKKKNRDAAISILRAISIRMPLIVYGAETDLDENITIDNFTNLVDDLSWKEFMPTNVTKEMFKTFSKYYDKDIFIGAALRIRAISKTADELEPTQRVKKIASLFKTFKNPDRETVLTPWRVVNMHMGEAIGGYNFFDNNFTNEIDNPNFIDIPNLTSKIFNEESKILEINSKSGLYPLYLTYTLYRLECNKYTQAELNFNKKIQIWDNVCKNKVFIICNTPMAKQITKRTLVGYRNSKVNARYFDDLINQLKQTTKRSSFIRKMHQSKSYWKVKGDDNMKFNAVVGNPPYQEEKSNNKRKQPLYHLFYDAAFSISNIVTLISPGRFLFNAGETPKEWNNKMLNDEHLKVVKYFNNSKDVFPTIDLKGGVAIMLRNSFENYGKIGQFVTDDTVSNILCKVKNFKDFTPFSTIVYPKSLYNLTDQVYKDYPNLKSNLSKGNEYIVDAKIFDKLANLFSDNSTSTNDIAVYGIQNKSRIVKYVNKKYIKNISQINNYKVNVSGCNGSGKMGETLSSPVVLGPKFISTQSFMTIGNFDTEFEANSCLKYVKTRFLRLLLGTLKITHNNSRETWANIPLQNFNSDSDINWNLSINDIDSQLFKKYGLSKEEKEFIISKVELMK